MPTAVLYGFAPSLSRPNSSAASSTCPPTAGPDIYTTGARLAFVVAANRDAIVADFRGAVEKAIAARARWKTPQGLRPHRPMRTAVDYNGGRNGGSRVIYDTNLPPAGRRWQQSRSAVLGVRAPDWVSTRAPCM